MLLWQKKCQTFHLSKLSDNATTSWSHNEMSAITREARGSSRVSMRGVDYRSAVGPWPLAGQRSRAQLLSAILDLYLVAAR